MKVQRRKGKVSNVKEKQSKKRRSFQGLKKSKEMD
jgi:hypothetical protein